MSLGTAVHIALEAYHSGKLGLLEAFQQTWSDYLGQSDEREKAKEQGNRMYRKLREYLELDKVEPIKIAKGTDGLLAEVNFDYLNLRGIIDLIGKAKEELWVFEHKSGKLPEALSLLQDEQTALYITAARESIKAPVVGSCHNYVSLGGVKRYYWKRSDTYIANLTKNLMCAIAEMEALAAIEAKPLTSMGYYAKPGHLCPYCSYQQPCIALFQGVSLERIIETTLATAFVERASESEVLAAIEI